MISTDLKNVATKGVGALAPTHMANPNRALVHPEPRRAPEETSCSVRSQALSASPLSTLNCRLLAPSREGPTFLRLDPLPLDPHTLPKRDVVLDLRRSGLRLRVVPRRIVVPHSAHFHTVVVRRPLPRTLRRMRTRLQKLFLDRIQREILVPFHHDACIALRDDFSTPSRLSHFFSPSILKVLPNLISAVNCILRISHPLGCACLPSRSQKLEIACYTLAHTEEVSRG